MSSNSRIYLVAEQGINAGGDMDRAKELIRQAKECGWDAFKWQKRDVETVYTKEFLDSPRESPWGTTQREQKMGLEFSIEQMAELFDYAHLFDLEAFASAWDFKSLQQVESLNPPHHKIASAFITHHDFCRKVASYGRHTFISTGMSTIAEIGHVVHIFRDAKCDFTLMHCISTYPCPEEKCNIRVIQGLRTVFDCKVGYSGHETGIMPSILAAALGAVAIERHCTWDRSAPGSDQSASLERRGMELLAKYARGAQDALGDGIKRLLPEEIEVAKKLKYWE